MQLFVVVPLQTELLFLRGWRGLGLQTLMATTVIVLVRSTTLKVMTERVILATGLDQGWLGGITGRQHVQLGNQIPTTAAPWRDTNLSKAKNAHCLVVSALLLATSGLQKPCGGKLTDRYVLCKRRCALDNISVMHATTEGKEKSVAPVVAARS